jgi:hypothetical protein
MEAPPAFVIDKSCASAIHARTAYAPFL